MESPSGRLTKTTPVPASHAVPAGTRVQVVATLIPAGARSQGVPDDTSRTSYQARVRGILDSPASLGEEAVVRTPTGREVTGLLEVVEPADTHTFGRPVQALVAMVNEIARLRDGRT